ncbi:hypothetical protein BU25DRAFT_455035 [Macroventuria anomochaeta]|uniref:Uncharacterized protein n=1 Tax=Macroventuria anomochaeta TaxID=301207 RepID=A0ACB6SBB6_9PLEO|nr:uncharacterized protein BU25DRAFT_455035 [Macroventuria anomochaeta]KAF2631596.1 hypothetical protein BU25DRAFT_455035 [Macroventuria anomochaeta]
MLGHTLACYLICAVVAEALPQSFVLDKGTIEGAVLEPPPPEPLLNTSSETLSSATTSRTTLLTSLTSTPVHTAAADSTVTTALNGTTSATCLPTTTVVITLPNPTPRPTTASGRSDDEDTLTDDEQDAAATPFDTAAPEPISKWPHWFTAATFTLVFYDILTLGIFLWLWIFGYLWWFRPGDSRGSGRERVWQRRGVVSEGTEMARMDMGRMDRFGGDRFGRYERTSEWVRTGRGYGRVRSGSWESMREAELEGEMRRLGMI